ncbi:MAG: hypothetical protein J6M56_06565 [Clostridia bacterium]|nr:hypothetical protein [Clostridia bacterium]
MKQRIFFLLAALLLCLALPAQAEIRFENAAFDGREVQVNLSIASETTPVYIILDQITLGGLPFDENSSNFADGWLGYPSEAHRMSCMFTVPLDEGFVHSSVEDSAAGFERLQRALRHSGQLDVSFRITLLEPREQIVKVDTAFHGDSTATWQRIDEIVAGGDTPAESDQPYTALISSKAFKSIRCDEPIGFPLGNVNVLVDHANMRVAEQRVIGFSVHQ